MELFKEINCGECGAKTNLFTRTKLNDEQFLCSKCTSMIPGYINKCLGDYTLEQYRELKNYIVYSNDILSKKFNENHWFHTLHIDTEHSLFYFDTGFFSKPIYFEFNNICDFDLVFSPNEIKEGFFGDKVIGKILFKLKMNNPYFYYEEIIARDVKAKAKTSFFGSKVEYDNPKGMDEFYLYFMTAWQDAIAAESYDNYKQENKGSTPNELQQAMTLFMIDDLSIVTLEEIREQRNRLIKTFHPDTNSETDTQYAQKINASYKILKENIMNS